MKIAVLGGRFDPPHFAHLDIAKEVLNLKPEIEKLIYMPVFQHNWTPSEASSSDRLDMLRILVGNNFEISDLEISRKGKSYTIDTIQEIRSSDPKLEISWIVGSDVLPMFNKWKDHEKLLELATFLVYPRPGYPIPENLQSGFEILKTNKLYDLSSTKVRKLIKEGKSINGLVPKEIEEYIKQHKLYE
jgi:nicotinate-nucleotide adenylyltransferase